jgi:hypothetical protein
MAPAFELRRSVIRSLEHHGIGLVPEGRRALRMSHVPLPPGFTEPHTEVLFRLEGAFQACVPAGLAYAGEAETCRQALSREPSGSWRPLCLDPAECTTLEGALRAALSSLRSPAGLSLSTPPEARAGLTGEAPAASALDQYATLLTPAVEKGLWPETRERDAELDYIEDAVIGRSPGSRVALVLGDTGSGRWATGAIGLGQRLIEGRTRRELDGLQLYLLNPATITGGLMMVGELERRVEQIATECAAGGHLLFISEVAVQVLRMLPPLHDLRVIARVTPPELRAWYAAAPNQVAAATLVPLPPLTSAQVLNILDAHRPVLQAHYGLTGFDEAALPRALELAEESLPGALPGTAVRLLEQACAITGRRAQPGAEPVVRCDHVLTAFGRLAGPELAEVTLNRWFDRAMRSVKWRTSDPGPPTSDDAPVES